MYYTYCIHYIFTAPQKGYAKRGSKLYKKLFVVPGHRVAKVKRAGISTSSGTGDGSWASKYDGQARGWDN